MVKLVTANNEKKIDLRFDLLNRLEVLFQELNKNFGNNTGCLVEIFD